MSGLNAAIVLQARMGSTRLPGKVLADLDGRPMVAHCIGRLRAASVGPVIVATTTRADDDPLADVARTCGASVFRGPDDDVLLRYVLAARWLGVDYVIRATADNPAVDVGTVRRTLDWLIAGDLDHAIERDLPVGGAVEAVRTSALVDALARTADRGDREHVTPFIRRDPRYHIDQPPAPAPLRRPDVRVTVDTTADLARMRQLLRTAGSGRWVVPLAEIIDAWDALPASARVA
jgi:spore coat polysaccharide biosynthesis protein SpsF